MLTLGIAMGDGKSPGGYLGGLARRLVKDGLLEEGKAREAQQAALKGRRPLVTHLVENKLVDSHALAIAASDEFGLPLFDIAALRPDPSLLEKVDAKLLEKHRALPIFSRGKRLFLAVSDPTNVEAVDEFKFNTGMPTEAVLCDETKLARQVDAAIADADSASMDLGDTDLDNIDVDSAGDTGTTDISKADADDAPIVRFVNKILLDAINKGASDIHFEPYEYKYRIRYRLDGILQDVASPPVSQGGRIAARVKVMSRLDLAERRIPQDGRIKLKLSKNKLFLPYKFVTNLIVKV